MPPASQDWEAVLKPGSTLRNFEIVRVLGMGGFGVTYLGYDNDLARPVAIKEYLPREIAFRRNDTSIAPYSSADKQDYEKGLVDFLSEAQTIARVEHPSIIKVFQFFRGNGTGYIVMEYAEGETLQTYLRRRGNLNAEEFSEIASDLLSGLQTLHDQSLLHRDIKPSNIIIRATGAPVFIDFGAARQNLGQNSRSVTSIITAGYGPIEQYSNRASLQGAWTDIYALGASFHYSISGKVPPDAPSRIMSDTFTPLTSKILRDFPISQLNAINSSLEREGENRPQSVAEWREVLFPDVHKAQPTPIANEPSKALVILGLAALILFFLTAIAMALPVTETM